VTAGLLATIAASVAGAAARGAGAAGEAVSTAAPASMPTLATLDWLIIFAYLGGVLALGAAVGRRQNTTDQYFRAAGRMPMFPVAISVLATSLSAATFIGGPEQAFRGDLTYLAASLGGILGAIVVAAIFIPAFYRAGVTTVYELLERSFGAGGRMAASAMFQLGRVFASGARLFIAAIPVAVIFFLAPGDTLGPASLIPAILIVALVATVYTAMGGIRAVIWTDLAQTVILVSAAVIAAIVLLSRIPLDPSALYDTLAAARIDAADPDSPSKLRLLDLGAGFNSNYNLLAILIGMTLFNIAAYGTDQDLTQRMLTCRNARAGSTSMILSQFLGLVTVALFMGLGLLLYLYYCRPDIMGAAAPAAIEDGREVFLTFILGELPVGVRGILMAGLFAAAMSSLDSALNAMSSAFVCDIYRPLRPGRDDRHYVRISRLAVGGWALALAGFACICTVWQERSDQTLINFALSVMVFAYGGLLGVFVAALCGVRRGPAAAIAALIAGFASVAVMRFVPQAGGLAFPWQMAVATAISLTVCLAWPRRTHRAPETTGAADPGPP
jgi:SSS family solute:Na+ symporter